MSSLAQEESQSISENVTWGQRKRMADGKVAIPFKHTLGFKRGLKGEILVDEEQAKTVRDIYDWFLEGLTPHAIAARLMENGVPSPRGKEVRHQGTVRSILSNEKYKGDALMQKFYTEDFQPKRKKQSRRGSMKGLLCRMTTGKDIVKRNGSRRPTTEKTRLLLRI